MKFAMLAITAGLLVGAGTLAHADNDDQGVFYGGNSSAFSNKVLKTDTTSCQGTLLASGLGQVSNDVHAVRPGNQRTFDIANQNVPWACLGHDTADSGTMVCPANSSRIRLSLANNEAKFECLGRG